MSIHNKNTQLLFLTTFEEKAFLNLLNVWLGSLLKFILKGKLNIDTHLKTFEQLFWPTI